MKQTKEKDCRGNALYEIFRTTASRRKVRFDEPPEYIQLKQADRILRNSQRRSEAEAGRDKLKAGNKVPTRAGAPLKTFEQFRADAGMGLTEELTKKQKDNMEQVYLSARALDFDKWVLFTTEML